MMITHIRGTSLNQLVMAGDHWWSLVIQKSLRDHPGSRRSVVPFWLVSRWVGQSWKLELLSSPSMVFCWKMVAISLFSPPARWGLLDFMSVASSSSSFSSFSSSSSSSPPPPPRPPRRPRRPCSTATRDPQCSLPDLNHDHPRPVFPAGPQPRPSTPNVPCRTSTTTILAQCSLPDLNHDHPRPVFPAGPQPRVSTPSVPCRTSCRKIWDKECAEES